VKEDIGSGGTLKQGAIGAAIGGILGKVLGGTKARSWASCSAAREEPSAPAGRRGAAGRHVFTLQLERATSVPRR
jgi:hypothetical protein